MWKRKIKQVEIKTCEKCWDKAKYDVTIDSEHIGLRCWWHKDIK